jgi:primosomal protein N' (replication factor Y)
MGEQQHLFDPEPTPWELDDAADRVVSEVALADVPGGPYSYLVPDKLRDQLVAGMRVRVPFGRGNRSLVGYCVSLGQGVPGGRPLKEIKAVVDEVALLSPAMLRLTRWMADYYLCDLAQVLDAVVPAVVRGGAGTREVTLLSVPTHVAARLATLDLPEKQLRALKCLAAAPRPLTPQQLAASVGCTQAPITGLRKKKLVQEQRQRVFSEGDHESPLQRQPGHQLNDHQQRVFDAIHAAIHAARHETLLIHGVTGSGKTEVYIRAIEEVVSFGRQAIVLVPEISLTPQTRHRFRSRFDHVAVLHSNLRPSERHRHWQRIVRGEIQVVVGARSAVFAPVPHLGLIVLDEEHESSFKQDTAPRYHARTVALARAAAENVPLVLGSATPSLESWHHARRGRYTLLEMPHRVLNRPLPDVKTIDLRSEALNRTSRGAISRQLHQAMKQALGDDGQVILLLNRRGFSTHIQCPKCGHVVSCPQCDIALTHHRQRELAVCHYCDHQASAPTECPECAFDDIRYSGFGTQRLEAEVRARFPRYDCLRMDTDTMRRPGAHEAALDQFRRGEVKILLGTQMIAKGLDFPQVTLVGVINADTALHLPDFRAAERTFQLVTQVAGRTGRGARGGRVLVQSFNPDHPAIAAAAGHDFARFANHELPTRKEYQYPPFVKMVRIVVRGTDERLTHEFAKQVIQRVREHADHEGVSLRLLGPAAAPISRLRGRYRYHALLMSADGNRLRQAVRAATDGMKRPDEVQWIVDVDPLDML